MTVPIPTRIYHITHMDNLPGILQAGGLLSHNQKQVRGIEHMNIAYEGIQDRRAVTTVPCGGCGVLHDYVPFFFSPRPPMLLALATGWVPAYNEGQGPIIYLVSTVQAVDEACPGWAFTDGHGTMAFTDFYDQITDLDKVDWAVMPLRYWNDTVEDPDRKRRRQAEFLVRDIFPWSVVHEIDVKTSSVGSWVQGILANAGVQTLINVHRDWYY